MLHTRSNDHRYVMPLGKLLASVLPENTVLPENIAKIEIASLTLDSRDVSKSAAFIAVKGSAVDSRNFISENLDAAAVIKHADIFEVNFLGAMPVISIVNLDQRVGDLADRFYCSPSAKMKVVGITGTNGKTTCAHLLSQLIARLSGVCGHIGTLGIGLFENGLHEQLDCSGLTTPSVLANHQALAGFSSQTRFTAIEASSHGIEQQRIAGVRFAGAVFTNFSRDHLDYHGSLEKYKQAKLAFFSDYHPSFIVTNLDDSVGREIFKQYCHTVKTIGVSTQISDTLRHKNRNSIYVESAEYSLDGAIAKINSPWGSAEICSPLMGEYNLQNVLCVIACACELGFDFDDVVKSIPSLKAVSGRLERISLSSHNNTLEKNVGGKFKKAENNHQPYVFVDFAHTPDALEKVLNELNRHATGKTYVVVGCGGDRDVGKRSLMGKVAYQNADECIFTSDNPRSELPEVIIADMLSGANELLHTTPTNKPIDAIVDRKQAITDVIFRASKNDTVLIAGKGHEKYQIVGNEKILFDDVIVARQALISKQIAAGGVA